jgi:hypothetical protein
MESIGDENIAGVLRALNPAINIPIQVATGVNPLTGEQEGNFTDPLPDVLTERGLLALNQLLSMPAPVRAVGANKVGKTASAIGAEFEAIDPNRTKRSTIAPWIPLSGSNARRSNDLRIILDTIRKEPEYGAILDAARSGDKDKLDLYQSRIKAADQAKLDLKKLVPQTQEEKDALEEASRIAAGGSSSSSDSSIFRESESDSGIWKNKSSSSGIWK